MSSDGNEKGKRPKLPIKYPPTEKKEEDKFCCPFCGSVKCSQVNLSPGPMAMPSPIPDAVYKCDGCSLTFTDPKKFTELEIKLCQCGK
ncbi:hypothetical protein KAR26_00865 [Candidatus Parcubacteria bacterium]|nr:hypothetical protein [Candidatus Parcubacteria bacterium]